MNQTHAAATPTAQTRLCRFEGRVQGVGFRPHVWRLARELAVNGEVYNDGDAACVLAVGEVKVLDAFYRRLLDELPARARVERVTEIATPQVSLSEFRIANSSMGSAVSRFPLETRSCDACLEEVADPADRRYGYAFTNCMDCGPRYSIIDSLPYDRASTSMSGFAMCPRCRAEYEDPADRRFHAQPIACPDCGPQLSFLDTEGRRVPGDPLALAIDALGRGASIAIKGLGGFHIACDATCERAVSRLRERKKRPTKPFAVMVSDASVAAALVSLTASSEALLTAPANPIVLLPWSGSGVTELVAPGQARLGVMLATTPLHVQLSKRVGRPLVMTSGNISGQPQCIDDETALSELGGVVDGFLTHNRPILNRLDDSVVCPSQSGNVVMRRGRGFAPAPLDWPPGFSARPGVLAVGAHLKNTCAISTEQGVLVSAHVGDLESERAQQQSREAAELMIRGTRVTPCQIVTDLHPDYASTQIGHRLSQSYALPIRSCQHHHAHMAACLFENRVPLHAGPVLGLVVDGMGLADDGNIWGGEWLLGGYQKVARVAHLTPRPLLGGRLAMQEPWRNVMSILLQQADTRVALGLLTEQPHLKKPLDRFGADTLVQLARHREFSPLASSGGRLVDAMAGVVLPELHKQHFEGEAGMALEALALAAGDVSKPYQCPGQTAAAPRDVDLAHLVLTGLRELNRGIDRAVVAWRMLAGLADALACQTAMLASQHGVSTIALSGGVFQNPFLIERLAAQLSRRHLTVLRHHSLSANDENIALGQVACALAEQEGG